MKIEIVAWNLFLATIKILDFEPKGSSISTRSKRIRKGNVKSLSRLIRMVL